MHVDETKINYYNGNVSNFEKNKNKITSKKNKDYKLQKKTIKEFESNGCTIEKAKKRTLEKLDINTLTEEQPKDYRVNFNFLYADDNTPTISVLDAGFRYGKTNSNSIFNSTNKASSTSNSSPYLFSGMRFGVGTSSRIAIVG